MHHLNIKQAPRKKNGKQGSTGQTRETVPYVTILLWERNESSEQVTEKVSDDQGQLGGRGIVPCANLYRGITD